MGAGDRLQVCKKLFPWGPGLDKDTFYSRKCPYPIFPGLVERIPGLLICRVKEKV